MLQLQTAIQGVIGGKDVFLPYYLPLEAYNGDQTWVSKGPSDCTLHALVMVQSFLCNGLCKS